MNWLIKIYYFLVDRCEECGTKHKYGSFGCSGFKYCPNCEGNK